jgi:Histidinol dehydrogenase
MTMRIFDWTTLTDADRRGVLARPAQESRADIAAVALEIVNAVRQSGDAALRSYTERFDGARLESLAVPEREFSAAQNSLTPQQHAALERAIDNVQLSCPNPCPWRRCQASAANGSFDPSQRLACTCRLARPLCPPPSSCWPFPRVSRDARTGSCARHQRAMGAQILQCS